MDKNECRTIRPNICGIYKITSPTNKIYIGQSVNIQNRYRAHLYSTNNTKLYRSFKKYGIENHKFEIVEICDLSILSEKEEKYIKKYNSIENGLNIIDRNYTLIDTSKCKNNYKWTNDRKKKHSEFIKKWWADNRNVILPNRDDNWKKKIGNKNKNKVVAKDKNGNFIKVSLDEFKKRNDLTGTTANIKQPKLQKKIKCITDDMIFNSLKEASKYYSLTCGNISTAIKKNKPLGMIKYKRELYFKYIY